MAEQSPFNDRSAKANPRVAPKIIHQPAPAGVIPIDQWMRRSTIKFFELNSETQRMYSSISLRRNEIARVLISTYEPILRDTEWIHKVARRLLAEDVKGRIYKEEEILGAEQELFKRFDEVGEWLDTRVKQAQERLANAGAQEADFVSTPTLYQTCINCRSANRYLNLISKADQYLHLMEGLSMIGELSDNDSDAQRAFQQAKKEAVQQVLSVVRLSTKLWGVLRNLCNRVREERLRERQERSRDQSRRDKEKAGTAAPVAPDGPAATEPVAALPPAAQGDVPPEKEKGGAHEEPVAAGAAPAKANDAGETEEVRPKRKSRTSHEHPAVTEAAIQLGAFNSENAATYEQEPNGT